MSAAAENPFEIVQGARAYVRRSATEEALGALAAALRRGGPPVAVTGPRGIGKSLLLELTAEELGHEYRYVYLPYVALPPAETCSWVLARLFRPQSADPDLALRRYADRLARQGSALVVLLDDVGGTPLPTAQWLGRYAARAGDGLRLALAARDGPRTGEVLEAVASDVEVVRLDKPMSEPETRHYVAARLERVDAKPELLALFDDETVGTLHRVSRGIPGRLHAAAAAVLRGSREPGRDVASELEELDFDAQETQPHELTDVHVLPAFLPSGSLDRLPSNPAPPRRRRRRPLLPPPPRARVALTSLLAAAALAASVALRPSGGDGAETVAGPAGAGGPRSTSPVPAATPRGGRAVAQPG